ncbi:MAG: hypothetical protein ABSC04_18605 [Syntrophobacteraceae bacterium]|jgi:hypothetical protein
MAPDRIELVPEHQKFIETLGWQWGIWGSFCLFLALLIMAPWKGPPLSMQWEISAISGATGLCLAGYEIWRRRNRTVLVKDGEQIAVYRKGRLDLIIAPREIILVKTGLDIILEVGVGLGAFAVLFTAIGIMEFFRNGQESIVDSLLIMLPGLTCGASLISAAWTMFACAHLRVPVKGRRFMAKETVLLPTSRMQELFSLFI